MVTNPLAERAISAYPLSVGTSLALESLIQTDNPPIDPERVIPQRVDLSQYETIWINVSTLFRNMNSAINNDDKINVKSLAYAKEMIREIELLDDLFSPYFSVNYYVCNYKKALGLNNNYIKLRSYNTPKQLLYKSDHDKTISILLRDMKEKIDVFDSDIKPQKKQKALILTHYAWDLLSYNNFSLLDLIESHTGILKKKQDFYTKILNGKDTPMIPFNKCFIRVFGDKEHFSPMNPKVKQQIIDFANECKWTQMTTKDKIIFDLNHKMKDQFLKEVLKTMF